jgi:hypothetical protein
MMTLASRRYSYSETTDNAIVSNNQEESDEEWEAKKRECSFCKMFLESPCREQFKFWSKCVDKAKIDNVEFKDVCADVSKSLFLCTSENHEYFQALTAAMEESENEEENESNDDSTNDSVDNKLELNEDHAITTEPIDASDSLK